jgi:hypothetical protein
MVDWFCIEHQKVMVETSKASYTGKIVVIAITPAIFLCMKLCWFRPSLFDALYKTNQPLITTQIIDCMQFE